MNTKKNSKEKKTILSQEDIMKVLDSCYEKAINGIPHVSKSIDEFALDYISKEGRKSDAAKAMIKTQVIKCATSGFITGFGGVITLPVSVPANLASVLYVQVRMIACVAYMAGYDVKSDQVQTLIYACLAGVSIGEVIKKTGVQIGEKFAVQLIQKIPFDAIKAINQKVGFKLLTKFGEKGIINLGKLVPGVGATITGGIDLFETRVIGQRAYKMFFDNDFTVLDESDIVIIDEEELTNIDM